ncbi:hypothetical protein AVEN_233312-1 [Araneus ventricosus]|uniref:Uncharacterized protein n=1 Tax=Araneus ventricosus TaxID=182803 RepID=A0A4Y2S4F7_ARAVE|nr:hypothetical protein AVEN_233312-1 [Araneus ventricosus]
MGSGGVTIEQDCVSMVSSMEIIFAVIVKLHSEWSLRNRRCHCPVTISFPKVPILCRITTIICVVLMSVNLHRSGLKMPNPNDKNKETVESSSNTDIPMENTHISDHA